MSKRLVLMFLVSQGVFGIQTFCNVLSLRIRHVTVQILNISSCCPCNVDDLGKSFLCHNVLHNNCNKAQKEFNQNVN